MTSKPLGDRLPKWNEPGCLMNRNETINWRFLKDMEVNEHMDMADDAARTNCYVLAARIGIKVSVSRLPNGDFRVTRIA